MTRTYLLSIIRNLWKNRVTTAINVLGLTLGLSSILFIYIQDRYESTFDTHQPRIDDIYRVNLTVDYPNRLFKNGNTQSMLVKAIRNEFPDLEAAIQIIGPRSAPISINPGTPAERVFEEERTIFYADSVFLKYFDYDFIAGHPRTALDDPNSVVLSTQLVEKYYPEYIGQEIDLLGQELVIHDSIRVQITGVISSPPNNSNFPFELLIAAEVYYKLNSFDRDNWYNTAQGMTFVVLAEGQTPEDIDQRFPALVDKYRNEEDAKITSFSLLNL